MLLTKQIIAMLGCFYFCTAALTDCNKGLKGNAGLRKGRLANTTPYDTSDKLVSRDYNDPDKFWCAFEKALQGEAAAMDFLVARGKDIDAKAPHKEEPGSVKIAIVKNSEGGISLILEYARKKTLLQSKDQQAQPITLMVAKDSVSAYKEVTNADPPPSYEKATNPDALPSYEGVSNAEPPPSYEKATNPEPSYITFMKRLMQYKPDLNSYNRYGETLLTEVIKNGPNQNQTALIELFLKTGANSNGLNRKQQAPLAVTKRIKNIENRKEIIKLLIDYGGNPLLAPTDKNTQEYVREVVIGQLKKVNLALHSPTCSQALAQADAKLPLFFNQKYNRSDAVLSGKKDLTCVVCAKKEAAPTTIQMPACGHYLHGSCLTRSLIHMKSKGTIKWWPRPSYIYMHLCPYCKKEIPQGLIKDLNQFYEGIKFEHMAFTLALRVAFAIPCVTVIPGGFVLAAGLFYPM